MCVLNKNLGLSRVDPKETIYTGVCPSESDAEEATNQESYCFCDQSSDCAPGNDVTSCPFELDGSCLLFLLFRSEAGWVFFSLLSGSISGRYVLELIVSERQVRSLIESWI